MQRSSSHIAVYPAASARCGSGLGVPWPGPGRSAVSTSSLTAARSFPTSFTSIGTDRTAQPNFSAVKPAVDAGRARHVGAARVIEHVRRLRPGSRPVAPPSRWTGLPLHRHAQGLSTVMEMQSRERRHALSSSGGGRYTASTSVIIPAPSPCRLRDGVDAASTSRRSAGRPARWSWTLSLRERLHTHRCASAPRSRAGAWCAFRRVHR